MLKLYSDENSGSGFLSGAASGSFNVPAITKAQDELDRLLIQNQIQPIYQSDKTDLPELKDVPIKIDIFQREEKNKPVTTLETIPKINPPESLVSSNKNYIPYVIGVLIFIILLKV